MAGPDAKGSPPIEEWAGKGVFYLIMLIVAIAFLQTVKLTMVTEPLTKLVEPFMAYLPRLIGAGILALIAWLLATVLRKIIAGVLKAGKLDEKLGGATSESGKPMALSETFAEVVYWLVFLLFLPAILQALEMKALLDPVTALFNKVFTFLPNIISGAAILLIGWFIARIVQRVIQSLLASAGLDRLSEKWGLSASLGRQKLSGVLGTVVYFIILLPVVVSALSALQLEAITKPASDMLAKIMAAMPGVLGAAIVLLLAVVIGKIVSGIASNALAGAGFNNLPVKLGLAKQPLQGRQTPASIAGLLLLSAIVLMASITAADMVGLPAVGGLIRDFIGFAGHILMGLLIFSLGLLLAQMVSRVLSASDSPNASRFAFAARVVILALAGAMALRQTGLANEIVNLAFGLTLGALAVAFALAFGLGGRDMAARTLDQWRASDRHSPEK
jgi:hypothetical protein